MQFIDDIAYSCIGCSAGRQGMVKHIPIGYLYCLGTVIEVIEVM